MCISIRDFKFLRQFAVGSDIVAFSMEAGGLGYCPCSFLGDTMGRNTSTWNTSVAEETGVGLRVLKLASDADKRLIFFFFSIGKIMVTMLTWLLIQGKGKSAYRRIKQYSTRLADSYCNF